MSNAFNLEQHPVVHHVLLKVSEDSYLYDICHIEVAIFLFLILNNINRRWVHLWGWDINEEVQDAYILTLCRTTRPINGRTASPPLCNTICMLSLTCFLSLEQGHPFLLN